MHLAKVIFQYVTQFGRPSSEFHISSHNQSASTSSGGGAAERDQSSLPFASLADCLRPSFSDLKQVYQQFSRSKNTHTQLHNIIRNSTHINFPLHNVTSPFTRMNIPRHYTGCSFTDSVIPVSSVEARTAAGAWKGSRTHNPLSEAYKEGHETLSAIVCAMKMVMAKFSLTEDISYFWKFLRASLTDRVGRNG